MAGKKQYLKSGQTTKFKLIYEGETLGNELVEGESF
jgi:hypothetical protein